MTTDGTQTLPGPLTDVAELHSPEAVVDDLTDTLLAISTFGIHDTRLPALGDYARAALERYNALTNAPTGGGNSAP